MLGDVQKIIIRTIKSREIYSLYYEHFLKMFTNIILLDYVNKFN